MQHDRELEQAIALELDVRAARGDMVKVKEIWDCVRVLRPPRLWHPSAQLAGFTRYGYERIKAALLAGLSEDFRKQHLPEVPPEYSYLVGEIPAWFFVPSLSRWAFSLYASPEHWSAGADLRLEMGAANIATAAPFQEKVEILRMTGAKNLFDLLTRKKVA